MFCGIGVIDGAAIDVAGMDAVSNSKANNKAASFFMSAIHHGQMAILWQKMRKFQSSLAFLLRRVR